MSISSVQAQTPPIQSMYDYFEGHIVRVPEVSILDNSWVVNLKPNKQESFDFRSFLFDQHSCSEEKSVVDLLLESVNCGSVERFDQELLSKVIPRPGHIIFRRYENIYDGCELTNSANPPVEG